MVSNIFLIIFGKLISKFFRLLSLGDGSTWPGHIALRINKNFIKQVLNKSKTKIIIVAGTNGKTTTSALIKTTLKKNGKRVFQNKSGANLLNGIASSLIINSDLSGKLNYDYAIFEIDENAMPQVLKECHVDYLILLNLFRDQLDRYGEVNIVASRWAEAVGTLSNETTLILNADDPQIAYLAKYTKSKTLYFGFNGSNFSNKTPQRASDSGQCPECSEKLSYKQIIFSHLGDWHCENCGLKRPKLDIGNFPVYPLPGTYNMYNAHAAVLLLKKIGLSQASIEGSFKDFKPAFGRQEIIEYKNKNVQIFLSKNPTSFNESFQTISDLGARTLLIVLNDRIPDGRDVSWIWDVDIEEHIHDFKDIVISGDRAYDMGLRIKYSRSSKFQISNFKFQIEENLQNAIDIALERTNVNETLYILPTYSAMLETRKILTGKKIL